MNEQMPEFEFESGAVQISLSSFWAKVLSALLVIAIVSVGGAAITLWTSVSDLETQVSYNSRTLDNTPRFRDLQYLEEMNAQRYEEILRRLARLERNQDEVQ